MRALAQPDIGSTWIHVHQAQAVSDASSDSMAQAGVVCLPEKTLIIQHALVNDEKGDLDRAVALAAQLRAAIDPSLKVALAVAPRNDAGDRAHLIRLQSLRHLVAEWDLHLALDLTGRLDESWEAEAAVLRMGTRLAVIRLGYPLPEKPGSPRWRLVRRILAAAADSEFGGVLSLTPRLSPWRADGTAAIAHELTQAVTEIRTEFRLRAEATQEGSRPGRLL